MTSARSYIRDKMQSMGLLPGGAFGFDLLTRKLYAGFGDANAEVITASSALLGGKADKLTPEAEGNMLIADANGNIADSGMAPGGTPGGSTQGLDWTYTEFDTGAKFFGLPIMRRCFTGTTGTGSGADVYIPTGLTGVETAWVDNFMLIGPYGKTFSSSNSYNAGDANQLLAQVSSDGSGVWFYADDDNSNHFNKVFHIALHYVYTEV